jgi:hypothetical protein
MSMINDFEKQVKTADSPFRAIIEDVNRAYEAGDYVTVKQIITKIQGIIQTEKEIKPVSAQIYLMTEPPEPDQLLTDTCDRGDKITIIGSSKQRKSFFMIQMALSLASGINFLIWKNCTPRRVLLIQFEVKEGHYHKRIRNMADALDISDEILQDNLQIINARGLGINGADGILKLHDIAKEHDAEIIIFDPLYKVMNGNENSAEAFKPILDAFDSMAEDTGAAISYVHHDAKGVAGERDIIDRGAGSNILGRDYDACIALSAHKYEESITIVETVTRNYRPRPPFCIEWRDDAMCFVIRPDIEALKMTASSKKKANNLKMPISCYEAPALDIVKNNPLPISLFKERLRLDLHLTCEQAKTFTDWATDPNNGKLAVFEDRGRGKNNKLIGLPDQIQDLYDMKGI